MAYFHSTGGTADVRLLILIKLLVFQSVTRVLLKAMLCFQFTRAVLSRLVEEFLDATETCRAS
jgi:hypothetical protein